MLTADETPTGGAQPPRKGRWPYLLAGALASLLCCGGAFLLVTLNRRSPLSHGLASSREELGDRPPVSPPHRDYLGVVLNGSTVDLASKVDGRLQGICCQVGDKVVRGQVVAALETKTVEHELRIAEALLRGAAAEEERVTVELAAARERLVRRQETQAQALSAEELSTAKYDERTAAARLTVAIAKVSEEKARVAQLQTALKDTQLRAPSDSLVAIRYLDPGALIRTGTPVVRLVSSERMRVRFAVPEDEGAVLAVGARVKVEVSATGTTLWGKLENVAPEVDAASRMIFALVTLQGAPTGSAKPFGGMVVRVSLVDPEVSGLPPTDFALHRGP